MSLPSWICLLIGVITTNLLEHMRAINVERPFLGMLAGVQHS